MGSDQTIEKTLQTQLITRRFAPIALYRVSYKISLGFYRGFFIGLGRSFISQEFAHEQNHRRKTYQRKT